MDDLIAAITKKKELQHINAEFVRDHVHDFLKRHPQYAKFLKTEYTEKSAQYKQIVKEIRAELRRAFGLFRDDVRKRKKFLSKLESGNTELLIKILETHSSTNERLPIYSQLYEKIWAITGEPKSILDLGCGINPYSFVFMRLKKVRYRAYDVSDQEVEMLTSFFEEYKEVDGSARILNVLDTEKLRRLPRSDVAFLFKMTDVLDRGKGHTKTEEVLAAIPAKYIVVSFPTRTMSGKKMTAPKRKWMEWLCDRIGYTYTILEYPNELFYVIQK